eukprot:2889707-Rhodomonas_salina.1
MMESKLPVESCPHRGGSITMRPGNGAPAVAYFFSRVHSALLFGLTRTVDKERESVTAKLPSATACKRDWRRGAEKDVEETVETSGDDETLKEWRGPTVMVMKSARGRRSRKMPGISRNAKASWIVKTLSPSVVLHASLKACRPWALEILSIPTRHTTGRGSEKDRASADGSGKFDKVAYPVVIGFSAEHIHQYDTLARKYHICQPRTVRAEYDAELAHDQQLLLKRRRPIAAVHMVNATRFDSGHKSCLANTFKGPVSSAPVHDAYNRPVFVCRCNRVDIRKHTLPQAGAEQRGNHKLRSRFQKIARTPAPGQELHAMWPTGHNLLGRAA